MYLTAEIIRNHVGSSSFERGRKYFTSHLVADIEADDDFVYGKVQGSEEKPYETEFAYNKDRIIDSQCSCPVGFACKHVAALALKAMIILSRMQPSLFKQPLEAISAASNWQKELSKLLPKNYPPRYFQLQLLLKLDFESAYGYYLHIARSGSRKSPIQLTQKLTLRPRIVDLETGRFSLAEIKWSQAIYNSNNIYWGENSGKIEEKQFLFLKFLSSALGIKYEDSWVGIPNENAVYVWHLLQKHDEYGVKLLGGAKGQIPILIDETPLEIVLELGNVKEGIQIRKKIFYQGHEADFSPLLVGEPPVFALVEKDSVYYLHPVQGESKAGLLKNLNNKLVIPETAVSSLEKQFLPELSLYYNIYLNTAKVTMPENLTPKLLLSLSEVGRNSYNVKLGFVLKDQVFGFSNTPETGVLEGRTVILNQAGIKNLRQRIKEKLTACTYFWENGKFAEEILLNGVEAARFYSEHLPKLQTEIGDLTIQKTQDFPRFTLDTSEPKISLRLAENETEYDWFDLEVDIAVGQEIVPFAELFQSLAEQEQYLLLKSGRYFPLNHPSFDKLRKLLEEAGTIKEKGSQCFRITRFQAGFWDELQSLGIVEKQAQSFKETVEKLFSSAGVTLQDPPPFLQAKLRPYQQEGFSWLVFLRSNRLGGILADDMGLGKTIQTIALISSAKSKDKDKKPFLVMAPTSVVENWDSELERFAPDLSRVVLRAGNRSKQFSKITKTDVVITSYPLLIRDFDMLKGINFDTIVLDEAQRVKNHQSKVYSLVRRLKTESRIALTGTPLENNLMELWSLCSIVAPGLFPEPKKFTRLYQIPIEKNNDKEILSRLRRRIKPFMLRRQKKVVERELPAKNEQIIKLALNSKHQHLYDLQLQHERKRVLGLLQDGGLKEHRFEILRSLMKLRQMCLHPGLLDRKHHKLPATKIEALQEYIEDLVKEGHKALIFSQFTSFLTFIKAELTKKGLQFLYLDGSTKNRGELVRTFQNGGPPLFLISLKAGGFGLNLTAADYCILLDPWWNPAVEQQAVDRTHRIGQTKPVFVYKLIVKDTIEEKVLALQEKKRKLFQSVMDDGVMFGSMITEEDIKNIFKA